MNGRRSPQPVELNQNERSFWQARYRQQASWTIEVQRFLLSKVGLDDGAQILEVGCAGGALLANFKKFGFRNIYGVDIDLNSLADTADEYFSICADGVNLPFSCESFSFVFCHYLLLWVSNPPAILEEAMRVLKPGGFFTAFAEPDYVHRDDSPAFMQEMGRLQNQGLRKSGARLDSGTKLVGWLIDAGFEIVVEGVLEKTRQQSTERSDHMELEVLRRDLTNVLSKRELDATIPRANQALQDPGAHIFVPTHYALGRKRYA